MTSYKTESRKLEINEYQLLRNSTEWTAFSDEQVAEALKNDLYAIAVLDQEKTVGIGRVIGDGSIYFYVQDIIVLPEYQGKGIGKIIMQSIQEFLDQNANENAFVGLMAATNTEEFYNQFGFKARADNKPGMFKIVQ